MNLSNLSDDRLTAIAAKAFQLGLADGREFSSPRTSHELIDVVAASYERLIVHRNKLRQVYGAGFDISKALSKR